ncbi:bacteriohemerythrin [Paludibacterium sp. B53371]|uniref:bacteriohemerythrin n=1 Tax=Paludibacterium sp. B53371 TaxID=2806263 RepID=UPI001C05DA38|nr:hemerythrin family protein [Paludibacterium sp. B53371]
MPISWDARFAIGHQTIDLQHQALFAILDDLQRWREQAGDLAALKLIVRRLEHYVLFHFETEESLMRGAALDPDYLARHLAAHRAFSERVHLYAAQLAALSPAELDGLLAFLTDWLQQHILVTDAELAKVLNAPTG